MKHGFVYVLSNELMPGLYKIGFTERSPSARCDELSAHTGVPAPFEVVMAAEVKDPQELELALHRTFDQQRVSSGKEFFALSPEQILEIRDLIQGVSNFPTILTSYIIADFEERKHMAEMRGQS